MRDKEDRGQGSCAEERPIPVTLLYKVMVAR